MNGTQKFHKANGPAFAPGQIWKPSSGAAYTVEIVEVKNFGPGKHDFEITYKDDRGLNMVKDAWNFQVRYYHNADAQLAVTNPCMNK